MSDGDLPLGEVVSIAGELGVQIGIADHVSGRDEQQFVASMDQLNRYLSALEGAPVLRSAELCWCDPFGSSLAETVRDRLDYLVGSNHGFALPDGTLGSPWWRRLPAAWRHRPQHLMEILVHNLCDLVAAMPIAIVAHPTLIPPALFAIESDVHAWWTPEREDRLIEATARSGVAIEISNRYRLPHARFLHKAREAGAKFSLGSDGHHRHQIAQLQWAVDAAVAAGIGDADLFIPDRSC
jgi:histidinol phosphatase-like PHP family hydrolase